MSKSHIIFTSPLHGTQVNPIHKYSIDQLSQIQALRDVSMSLFNLTHVCLKSFPIQFAETILLPQTDSYHPWELRWLNLPDTIPRYMRAAKWRLDDAQKRLRATIEWRREFKPDLIPPDDIKIECETGKMFVIPFYSSSCDVINRQPRRILNGFDNDGRPILYMRPGRENTETSPRQVRHLVWWLYVLCPYHHVSYSSPLVQRTCKGPDAAWPRVPRNHRRLQERDSAHEPLPLRCS